MEDTVSIIAAAQQGDELALDRLMRILRDFHCRPQIFRYFGVAGSLGLSDDELTSDFLVGAYMALPGAKLDVGSPIAYLAWKGRLAVADRLRKEGRRQKHERILRDPNQMEVMQSRDDMAEAIETAYLVKQLRGRLEGRALQLFDALVLEEIRGAEKNYQKTLAERWGVAQPSVAITLRRLKAKIGDEITH